MNATVTALAATAFTDEEYWSQRQTDESLPKIALNTIRYHHWHSIYTSNLDWQVEEDYSSDSVRDFVTTTVYFSSWTDSRYELVTDQFKGFFTDFKEKRQTQRNYKLAYKLRIEMLRHEAALDGFVLNDESYEDFWSFIGSVSYLQKANLVLMDNGNLRAIWKDEYGNRLGLQFLGERLVESVVFKRRSSNRGFSRVAGNYTMDEVIKQIFALDLSPFVFDLT